VSTTALERCGWDLAKLQVFALDPSNLKAGGCFHDGTRSWSTQGSPLHVARWAIDSGALAAHLIVVEEPFGLKATKITKLADGGEDVEHGSTPENLVRLGRSAGFVEGYLEGYRHKVHSPLARGSGIPIWRPYPVVWRGMLGLNRRSTPQRSAREETAIACWQYARAVTRRPLEGAAGGASYDESMAICMVEAIRGVAQDVLLMRRAQRSA
jgi:hypothetical protein